MGTNPTRYHQWSCCQIIGPTVRLLVGLSPAPHLHASAFSVARQRSVGQMISELFASVPSQVRPLERGRIGTLEMVFSLFKPCSVLVLDESEFLNNYRFVISLNSLQFWLVRETRRLCPFVLRTVEELLLRRSVSPSTVIESEENSPTGRDGKLICLLLQHLLSQIITWCTRLMAQSPHSHESVRFLTANKACRNQPSRAPKLFPSIKAENLFLCARPRVQNISKITVPYCSS